MERSAWTSASCSVSSGLVPATLTRIATGAPVPSMNVRHVHGDALGHRLGTGLVGLGQEDLEAGARDARDEVRRA